MNATEIVTRLEKVLHNASQKQKRHLLDKLNALLADNDSTPIPTQCPRCQCPRFVKKGKTATGQRYLCQGCERAFGASTNKVLGMSKLEHSAWQEFVTCFVDGVTIRRSAQRCKVSVKTAFFMRHRLLEIIEKNHERAAIGGGVHGYIDETYFPLNYKGSTPIGRKAHRRGKSSGARGLSKNLACIVMGTTSTGESFYQLAGCGGLSKKRARLALSDIVKENAHIHTDGAAAYDGLFEQLGATHRCWDTKKERGRLSPVNSLHSKTKRFMRRFNGVATKYMPRYLAWMLWLDNSSEEDVLEAAIIDTYTVKRIKMTGEYLPPMDDLTRQTVTRML